MNIWNSSPSKVPDTSKKVPNRLVQAVTLLTWIMQALGSNLGRSSDFPDRIFFLFYSVPPVNGGYHFKIGHDRSHQNPFQFIIHHHPIIRRHRFWATDGIVALINWKVLVPCLAYSSILKMEAVRPSETLVSSMRRCIPEDILFIFTAVRIPNPSTKLTKNKLSSKNKNAYFSIP
jgi:hypothetical protein